MAEKVKTQRTNNGRFTTKSAKKKIECLLSKRAKYCESLKQQDIRNEPPTKDESIQVESLGIQKLNESDGVISLEGRRIIEIDYMAKHMFCLNCESPLLLCNITKEHRMGLGGWFVFKCSVCFAKTKVPMGKRHSIKGTLFKNTKYAFDVNSKAALGE